MAFVNNLIQMIEPFNLRLTWERLNSVSQKYLSGRLANYRHHCTRANGRLYFRGNLCLYVMMTQEYINDDIMHSSYLALKVTTWL